MRSAIAVYIKEQYPVLLETAQDAENMESSWEEWFKNYLIFKENMQKSGIELYEVVVDVNELNDYCAINGYNNNAATRELFVAFLASHTK